MVTVEVRRGDIERAIILFRRQVGKDGVLQQLKERSMGHKHSDFVKAKMRKARRLRLKMIKRMENRQ